MPTESPPRGTQECLEFSVEELLRRARTLPPHAGVAINDLTDEEADAFLDAIRRRPVHNEATHSS